MKLHIGLVYFFCVLFCPLIASNGKKGIVNERESINSDVHYENLQQTKCQRTCKEIQKPGGCWQWTKCGIITGLVGTLVGAGVYGLTHQQPYNGPIIRDIFIRPCGNCSNAMLLDVCDRLPNVTQDIEKAQIAAACPGVSVIHEVSYKLEPGKTCGSFQVSLSDVKKKCNYNISDADSLGALNIKQRIKIQKRRSIQVKNS